MIRSFEEFVNENDHLKEFTKDDFVSYLKNVDKDLKKISVSSLVQTASSNAAFSLMNVTMTKHIFVDSFQKWETAKLDGFFDEKQFIVPICPVAYFSGKWAGILFNREGDLYVPKIIINISKGSDAFLAKRIFSMLSPEMKDDFVNLLSRNKYVEKIQTVVDDLPSLDIKSFRGIHVAKKLGI